MSETPFRVLLSDIGGVLGTNGWDSGIRHDTCRRFGVDPGEIDKRHHLMFDSYERGFLRLDDYLQAVFFAEARTFTLDELRRYIFTGSIAWPENIAFFNQVKTANKLKLGLVSNEGQGITEHRVDKFRLRELADFMVISHCVHMRKPDPQIWQLALDLAQVRPEECIYVDDREIFVTVAAKLGFTAVHHLSLDSTRSQFLALGLKLL
jgi:putative hydrolase of the HAD superfamily